MYVQNVEYRLTDLDENQVILEKHLTYHYPVSQKCLS